MWQVTHGPCTIDGNHCLRSPNYPSKYAGNQVCTIAIDDSLAEPIAVKAFETEAKYDKLIINGDAYSGNVAPNGIVPQGSISWSSDGSVSKTGFNLCPQSATTIPTTTIISPTPGMWKVMVGQCQVDASGCVASPNYPEKYGKNDNCVISVVSEKASQIKVENFLTESKYDKLMVNGKFYHGLGAGLDGVLPVGPMVWTSDGSVEKSGWRLCPTR